MNWLSKSRGEIRSWLSKDQLSPINDIGAKDIVIVGFPKSGNTWVQNLIAGLVYGLDPRLTPEALIQELVPDVHFKERFRRFRTPTFFKSHALPNPTYRQVVYLVRDPRDVLVSWRHHVHTLEGRAPSISEMLENPIGNFGFWADHVQAWLTNPYKSRFMLVRYEELLKNPQTELGRIASFAGLERDQDLLQRVVAGASLENLRNKQFEFGPGNKAWPTNVPFFRKGQAGSYKDELSEEDAALVFDAYRYMMEQLGYQEHSNPSADAKIVSPA